MNGDLQLISCEDSRSRYSDYSVQGDNSPEWHLMFLASQQCQLNQRVFSGAKITMSDRQCRLGDNINEALECRKSLEQEGLISGVHYATNEMEHMLEALYHESMAKEK